MNSYGDILKGMQSPLVNGGPAPEPLSPMEVRRYGNQVSIVPHVRTFNSISQWMSRTYRFRFDEALQRNYNSAKAMRNDAFIQGLYRKRMTPVTKSDFTIESEGPGASEEVNAFYKAILEQTPQWHDFRRNVGECVWFGRYANQMAFDELTYEGRKFEWKGNKAVGISHWVPCLGDKITFTFDFFPCIRVSPIYISTWRAKGATILQPGDPRVVQEAASYRWSEEGPVIVLDNPEVRKDFVISMFEVQDAPWDEPTLAGGIRGVGLRHYTFWNWDNKQEIVGWAMNYLEEFGAGGYTVVAYDGPEGLKRQQEAFADPMQKIIYVPIIPGTEEKVTDSVTRLEPATTGNDAIMKWAKDYFGADLEVLFLGHPANAKAVSTGLGSSVADRAADDLKLINRSDAEIIDTAMSHDVLPRLKFFNDPSGQYTLRFVSTIRGIDKQAGMTGADTLYKWGGKIPKAFAYMLADVPMLKPDEEYLQDPAHAQAEMQMQAQQVALGGGADTSYMERGSQHIEAVDSIFSGGNEATLETAQRSLMQAGVPKEDVLGTLAAAVSAGKIEEHDVSGGVHYTKPGSDHVDSDGKRVDPDQQVASYSVETDPASKWTEETGPISGKPRWRNNETGRIQYKAPGTGRHVQAVDRSEGKNPSFKLDQGKYGVGVGLLPGKGLATGVVEDRVLQLAKNGGKSLEGEGVLAEIMHVDKRLMKAQAISLAAKLGLQIDSKTSKTQALAHIENTLRSKQQQAKGATPAGASPSSNLVETNGKPGKAASSKGDAAPLLAMAEQRGHVAATEKEPAGVAGGVASPAGEALSQSAPTPSGSPTTEGKAVSADSPGSTTAGERSAETNGSETPGSADTVKPAIPRFEVPVKSTVEQMRDIAKDKHTEAKNKVNEHNAMLRSAKSALLSHDDPNKTDGLFTKTGKLRMDKLAAIREGDYASVPGLLDVAKSMAGNYNEIFNPNGAHEQYGDNEGDTTDAEKENATKLLKYMKEGPLDNPKLADYENQAFQDWYDSHPGQGEAAEPEAWDDTSFDFGGDNEREVQGDTGIERDATVLADNGESQISGGPGAWGDSSYPAPLDQGIGVSTPADGQGDRGGVASGEASEHEPGSQSDSSRDANGNGSADYHPSGVDPNAEQGSEAGRALSQAEVPQDALPERSGSGGDPSANEAEVPAPGGSEGSKGEAGFMEQEAAGRYQADDLEEMAGQSFTNDKGLSIDVSKDEDGTWSVGKRYGLSAQGAANYMNELKAEKAQGLFSSDVTAQAPVAKAAEKWEWAKPTTKQEAGELPGMKDTFAPGMFAAGSAQREQAKPDIHKAYADLNPGNAEAYNTKIAKPILSKMAKGWTKAEDVGGKTGLHEGVTTAARIMKEMVDAGHGQIAWDESGMPHYAANGIAKPDHLYFEGEHPEERGHVAATTESKPSGTQKAVESLKAGMAALQGGRTNEQGESSQQERSGSGEPSASTAKPDTQGKAADEGGGSKEVYPTGQDSPHYLAKRLLGASKAKAQELLRTAQADKWSKETIIELGNEVGAPVPSMGLTTNAMFGVIMARLEDRRKAIKKVLGKMKEPRGDKSVVPDMSPELAGELSVSHYMSGMNKDAKHFTSWRDWKEAVISHLKNHKDS